LLGYALMTLGVWQRF